MEPMLRPATAVGYLLVEVKTAEGALPVSGAQVTVTSQPGEGNVRITVETDKSGRTERLVLPTASRNMNQSSDNPQSYISYHVSVVADGYYPFEASPVPVFVGVTTLQPAILIGNAAYNSDSVFPRGNISIDETPEEGTTLSY